MDSIQINTGEKRLSIVRDGTNTGELVFDPSDVTFAERFYKLYQDIETKAKEYESLTDPENIEGFFSLVRDANQFLRERIDYVFGAGTSQMAFGESLSRDFGMYIQFLDGVKPHIASVRAEKIQQYLPKKAKTNGRKRTK